MADEGVLPQRVKNMLSSFLIPTASTSTDNGNDEEQPNDNATVWCLNNRDRGAFHKRVESFSTLKWLAKPADTSPLVCARYGWENVEEDLLQCVSCSAFLCGQLPDMTNQTFYRETKEKLKESLIGSHRDLCPWRTNPSPESFTRISVENRTEALQIVQPAYLDFISSNIRLPILSFEALEEVDMDEVKFLAGVTPLCKSMSEDHPLNLSAFCLAMFGWKKSTNEERVIFCEHCRRRVGLWAFTCELAILNRKPLDSSSSTLDTTGFSESDSHGLETNFSAESHSPDHVTNDNADSRTPDCGTNSSANSLSLRCWTDSSAQSEDEDVDTPKAKRMKQALKQGFDPISEHRTWCPWVTVPPKRAQKVIPWSHSRKLATSTPSSFINNMTPFRTNTCADSTVRTESDSTSPDHNWSNSSYLSDEADISYSDSAPNLSYDTSLHSEIWFSDAEGQVQDPTQLPPWQEVLVLLSLLKSGNLERRQTGDLKSSPPLEGMRHIRRILREWGSSLSPQTSPKT